MMPYIQIKIWSGNGLLPGCTKPLTEPVLTYHQLGPMASDGIIIRKSEDTNQQNNIEKGYFYSNIPISQVPIG